MFLLLSLDINKTVEELAELYAIDIQQKRISLLNDWLENPNEINFNTTVQFAPNYESELNSDGNSDNVKRAAYLCSGKDIEFWREYLSNKGLSDTETESRNFAYKAKALTCFCMITDPKSIHQITGFTKNEVL